MFIEWQDIYLTGNPIVDKEHKALVDSINDIHSAIKYRGDTEHALKTFHQLIKATQDHFSSEESLMQKCNYSKYTEHKEKHDTLLDELKILVDNFSNNPESLCLNGVVFLKQWFLEHAVDDDLNFAKAVNDIENLK